VRSTNPYVNRFSFITCLKSQGIADTPLVPLLHPRAAAIAQRDPRENFLSRRERSPYVARVSRDRAISRGFTSTYLSSDSAWRARRPATASAVLHRLQYGSQTGSRQALALLVTALSPIHNRRKSRWLDGASFRDYRRRVVRRSFENIR